MAKFCWVVLLAAAAFAQKTAPPVFEVASVKMSRQEALVDWALNVKGETLTIRNRNLRVIAAWAYNLQWSQIAGPVWIDADRFDIIAKAGKAMSEDEMRPMLQSLLAERFGLVAHRETRTAEVLALTVPKSGHKMTVSTKPEGAGGLRQDAARGPVIEGVSLAEFCENMSHDRDSTPFVDLTGLTGRFDFPWNLQKYREAMVARMRSESRPVSEAELRLSLMQELIAGELGLKLEPRRAPVEFLVIDRAEQKPSEN